MNIVLDAITSLPIGTAKRQCILLYFVRARMASETCTWTNQSNNIYLFEIVLLSICIIIIF